MKKTFPEIKTNKMAAKLKKRALAEYGSQVVMGEEGETAKR
jgi:hypothetical protein